MTCVKTGCNIVFAHTPDNVYRGDAHYYANVLVFRVWTPEYNPEATIDFIIECPSLELGDTIVSRIGGVALKSSAIREMWLKYSPHLLDKVVVDIDE